MTQLNGNLQDLKLFCIQNLKRHYNPKECLFRYREFLNPKEKDARLSFRYSIIALLGLLAHREHPLVVECFDLDAMIHQLVKKCTNYEMIQDLGLMLWLDAYMHGGHADTILKRIEQLLPAKKENYLATYELAWIVTGISYALQKYDNLDKFNFLHRYCPEMYQLLVERYNPKSRLFFHCAPLNLKMKIRRPISDFADQIYSIYAFLCYYELTGDNQTLEFACDCGKNLLDLQGPNGEWWWLYNSSKGNIAYRYPVYTVHQDGMAPMALMKLEKITQMNFNSVIEKSFSWVFNTNGRVVVDYNQHRIIRGVRIAPFYLKHLAVALSLLNFDSLHESVIYRYFRKQDVIKEYRAYHLGWVLYFIHYWEQMQNRNEVVA